MVRIVLLSIVFLTGCTPKVSQEELQYLNGYWEIERVTFPNGQSREFQPSTTIDYIELNELKGFRKKVQPKFDGTFATSDDAELFTIVRREDIFQLQYSGSSESWQEDLIAISENQFTVINQDTVTYNYKRYEPLNLSQ